MNITQLIAELEKVREELGDLTVYIEDVEHGGIQQPMVIPIEGGNAYYPYPGLYLM